MDLILRFVFGSIYYFEFTCIITNVPGKYSEQLSILTRKQHTHYGNRRKHCFAFFSFCFVIRRKLEFKKRRKILLYVSNGTKINDVKRNFALFAGLYASRIKENENNIFSTLFWVSIAIIGVTNDTVSFESMIVGERRTSTRSSKLRAKIVF